MLRIEAEYMSDTFVINQASECEEVFCPLSHSYSLVCGQYDGTTVHNSQHFSMADE